MKKLYIMVLLALVTAGGVFAAETPEKVSTDAKTLLATEEEKASSNHLFMDETVLNNLENRNKLNEFRGKFNAINTQIHVLKNQISVELNSRTPDVQSLSAKRQQLQVQIDEHDKVVAEYKQWVSTLK